MEDYCLECQLDAQHLAVDEVVRRLRLVARTVGSIIDGAGGGLMRRRPDPRIWSAVEYLGHLGHAMAITGSLSSEPWSRSDPSWNRWTRTPRWPRRDTSTSNRLSSWTDSIDG